MKFDDTCPHTGDQAGNCLDCVTQMLEERSERLKEAGKVLKAAEATVEHGSSCRTNLSPMTHSYRECNCTVQSFVEHLAALEAALEGK